MATDYFAEKDPITGQPKKKNTTQLGYQDPNTTQPTQLSKEALSGGATQQQQQSMAGNNNVLQTAQNNVLSQGTTPTPLQTATQQSAMQWVQDPTQGYNAEANKQAKLEKASTDRANLLESLRRQYGNVSGSGLLQKNMLESALESNVDLRNYESQLDDENYNRMINALSQSIATGQNVGQQQEDIFSQRLGNLATTRGMAESERGQLQENKNILGQMEQQQLNELQRMAEAQGYNLETMTQEQRNSLTRMALNQGYTMEQIDAAQRNAERLALLNQQFNIQTIDRQQQNEIERMAISQGYTLETMNEEQKNSLEQMAVNQGYTMEQIDVAQQNAIELAEIGQRYNIENMNEQQRNILNQLAVQQGYNLQTMNEEQIYELARMATSQGYNLETINAQQQNDLEQMAISQGYTLDTMNEEQKNSLEQMAVNQGYTMEQIDVAQQNAIELAEIGQRYNIENMNEQQRNTLEQMATAQGYTLEAMSEEQKNELINMAVQQGYNLETIDANQLNTLEQMATQQGYNLETMSEEEKHAFAQMTLQQGFTLEQINVAQQNAIELSMMEHSQALGKLSRQYGYDQALQYSDQQFQKAMATQDYQQARTIQRDRLEFEAQENVLDRALTREGMDIDQISAEYSMLKDAVSSGQASPADLINFLNQNGIDVTAVDTVKATQEALDAEYAAQEYQYAKTHPEFVDPINQDLTDEGKQQFLDYFNRSVFGETGVDDYISGIVDAKQLPSEPEMYNEIAATAPDWSPDVSRDGRGFWNPDVRTINNAPAQGTYFTYNGTLYYSTSGVSEETKGQNYQYFTALDVNNGTTVKIRANDDANGISGV